MTNTPTPNWDDPEDEMTTPVAIKLPSESKYADSAYLDMTNIKNFARDIGIDLSGSNEALMCRAMDKANQTVVLQVEAGLFLAAAKAQCEHGEFTPLVESFNFNPRRAQEWIQCAEFVSRLPKEARDDMLMLGKSKLLLLSQTDPEVVQEALKGEGFDVDGLSIAGTRRHLKEVEAKLTQRGVENKKLELENERLQKQLVAATATRADVTDIVPPHVSDIRLECAALYLKAELSVDGIARLTNDIHLLDSEWALSAARSTFAALQSLLGQVKGAAAALHKTYGADLDGDHSTMERLTQKELFKCAVEYRELTGEHEHEAALRAHERDLDKPKGKGRPKAAPIKD